jgi:hypothetical protein
MLDEDTEAPDTKLTNVWDDLKEDSKEDLERNDFTIDDMDTAALEAHQLQWQGNKEI